MSALKRAKKNVLSYPLVVEAINSDEDKKTAVKYVEEIHGEFKPSVVASTSKIIDKSFKKLYDKLNLTSSLQKDLRELVKDHHVVLVPNHQSHADYVAITYMIYNHYKLPVYVAGGINLDVFPIGSLFRNSGCFFLRRSFAGDKIYRAVFEGYIFHLLKQGDPIEFFFEGGRSRSGKLLPPRYGLFQMILEAHEKFPEEDRKPLLFVPVSIAHEYVPESKAHVRELGGGQKKTESPAQLLKLYKLFSKRLGSIHVHLGEGYVVEKPVQDKKKMTQEIAFKCFLSVGKGIPVTPSALLAMIMLDEPAGAITWEDIEDRGYEIVNYCKEFGIPLTENLASSEWSKSLDQALGIHLRNKRVRKLEKEKLRETFYYIEPEHRLELLYFKNMILHHFLVPCFINATWLNFFNGQINSPSELTRFLLQKRKELKYEFYLPSVKELLSQALKVISYAIGREIKTLEECLEFSHKELYQIAAKLRNFSSAFVHLYEAYYLGGVTLKHLLHEKFNSERFLQVSKEVFDLEKTHGRVIRYSESYSVQVMKNCLAYYQNQQIIQLKAEKYTIEDFKGLDDRIEKFGTELNNLVAVNFKLMKV